MELSSAVFRTILSPLSAFQSVQSTEKELSSEGVLESGQATQRPEQDLPSSQPVWTLASPDDNGSSRSCTPTLASSRCVAQASSLTRYKWTIQGADPDARRFFAVPQFALNKPPLRIDVHLPPLEDYTPEVRCLLKPEEAIYSPGERIPLLAVSRWLAGVLEQWCTAYDSGHGDEGKFQREYESMPFGSRIFVTISSLSDSSRTSARKVTIDHEIYLVPDYDIEQEMLIVDALKEMWGDLGPRDAALLWPEVIDLEELHLKRQFHEAISIVTISRAHPPGSKTDCINGSGNDSAEARSHNINSQQTLEVKAQQSQQPEQEYVFKSLTRDQRYLYNELKMLLSLNPHDNIIPKPRYIVTKRGRFGGRRGVCGFVLEYFSTGSLKQFLVRQQLPHHRSSGSLPAPLALPPEVWGPNAPPPPPMQGTGTALGHFTRPTAATASTGVISLDQKVHWAKQITRALIHVNTNTNSDDDKINKTTTLRGWYGFYPDLKPDNIVLRQTKSLSSQKEVGLYDAVLLDLEQRGGWFSWSPPEIKYLEYLEILLNTSTDEMDQSEYDLDKLEDFQDEVRPLLKEFYSLAFASESSQFEAETGEMNFMGSLNGNFKRNGKVKGYFNSEGGFSTPWLALLAKRTRSDTEGPSDLENAQIFMLGKLLWCIFEEEPLMRCGIDHEMLSDLPVPVLASDVNARTRDDDRMVTKKKAFPEFEHTPVEVRNLIMACTTGAEELEDDAVQGWRVVLNREGKLAPSSSSSPNSSSLDANVTAEDTQRQAREYWTSEVEKARAFVSDLVTYERQRRVAGSSESEQLAQGQHSDNDDVGDSGVKTPSLLCKARSRPTLAQVLKELEQISGEASYVFHCRLP